MITDPTAVTLIAWVGVPSSLLAPFALSALVRRVRVRRRLGGFPDLSDFRPSGDGSGGHAPRSPRGHRNLAAPTALGVGEGLPVASPPRGGQPNPSRPVGGGVTGRPEATRVQQRGSFAPAGAARTGPGSARRSDRTGSSVPALTSRRHGAGTDALQRIVDWLDRRLLAISVAVAALWAACLVAAFFTAVAS